MQNRLLSLPPLDALRGFVAAARRMSITVAASNRLVDLLPEYVLAAAALLSLC